MGYKVTLNAEEITTEKLEAFDVIMTGIRAYNVLPLLQVSKRYFLILLNLENNDSAIQYT
jgi:hypothetical protein